MTVNQFARVVQQHGPWIRPLLRSHARALGDTDNSILRELTQNSREGTLVALDIPGPARGYAVIRPGGQPLQLHVLDSEGDEAIHALFGAIHEIHGSHGFVVEVSIVEIAKVSPKIADAVSRFGGRYDIWLDDDRDVVQETPEPEESPADPEPEPEGEGDDEDDDAKSDELDDEAVQKLVDESRYAKMRRPELEKIAKERSIFIPKKIDDLRRALFESDGGSEPFED